MFRANALGTRSFDRSREEERKMNNHEIDVTKNLAVQTAMLSALIEELISKGLIDRQAMVKRYYDLLNELIVSGDGKRNAGGIRHLIYLLETDS